MDELEEADSFQVWDHLDEDVSLNAIEQALSRYYKSVLKTNLMRFLLASYFDSMSSGGVVHVR
ncbi:MAG: hypothetical protein V3S97_00880, partial [Candidatus Bathyarchaeia archaeon]